MTARASDPRRPLGFGVVAGLDPAMLEPLAVRVAELGYGSFWINDGGRPEADGLAGLAIVAAAAPGLELGVGVLPLDHRPPDAIAAVISRLGLPLDRLRLGIGSGGAAHPLALVRDGVDQVRRLVPTASVLIAALGPRMCRLAGEVADGVLFNWAVPHQLEKNAGEVRAAEEAAGRGPIDQWAYVRCAVGPGAQARLGEEARRYAANPAYGRAFAAMGEPFERVGVAGEGIGRQLEPYRALLDGVVVRALPVEWRLGDLIAIAEAAVERV